MPQYQDAKNDAPVAIIAGDVMYIRNNAEPDPASNITQLALVTFYPPGK
jgi:hypothetical protein